MQGMVSAPRTQPSTKLDTSPDPCLLPPFTSVCPGFNGPLQTTARQQGKKIEDLEEKLEERQVSQVAAETHSSNYQVTITGLKVGVLMVGLSVGRVDAGAGGGRGSSEKQFSGTCCFLR